MQENITETQAEVVCFGEVLWDIFPEGPVPGGAPMNVAYHLSKAGIPTSIISSVGNDEFGKRIIKQLQEWNISTHGTTIDPKAPTGTVVATVNDSQETHYEILQNVAWDYIQIAENIKDMINSSSTFVYGSLAARSPISRNSLFELLSKLSFKVFDINIRPPFYSFPLLEDLLKAADLVKLNEAELKLLLELHHRSFTSETDALKFLEQTYEIKEFILTKGGEGASYYFKNKYYQLPVVPVKVQDTVGSGDAFLAGFLSQRINGAEPECSLIEAIALSAYVTARKGACPPYTSSDYKNFREKAVNSLNNMVNIKELN